MIYVQNRRRSLERIAAEYPSALVVDVTSNGSDPWVKFSPFFPHGNIPVPFSPGRVGASVEGIWQGLKVFESVDVDPEKFEVVSMKGLKRTSRSFGKVLGHRKGLSGTELLSYLEARESIYLPCYKYVLEHCLEDEVRELRKVASVRDLVLLDYETNADVHNLAKPLSHASLVAAYVEGKWLD